MILMLDSQHMHVLPLLFMNFCKVLFIFSFSSWISVELSSGPEYTVTEVISDAQGIHSQILTSLH